MSRHEGVSCDSCLKGNFHGRRYKCLICYDYDLCAACYEAGVSTTRHTPEHPMQCILTRADFDLYYGGEALSAEQPQAFTCPYCGRMGFTEASLQDHVASDHADTAYEVVCPVCASLPGGDPNHVTDDFAAHLTLEHRSGTTRELEESSGSHRGIRRTPHPPRGVGGPRARRSNMHFSSAGGLSTLSPSTRDSVDPIAELLSQLSGVRRNNTAATNSTSGGPGSASVAANGRSAVGAPVGAGGIASHLHELQMELQMGRQQIATMHAARQHVERMSRRHNASTSQQLPPTLGHSAPSPNSAAASALAAATAANATLAAANASGRAGLDVNNATAGRHTPLSSWSSASSGTVTGHMLLPRLMESHVVESDAHSADVERANRSLFVQELLLTALSAGQPRHESLSAVHLTELLGRLGSCTPVSAYSTPLTTTVSKNSNVETNTLQKERNIGTREDTAVVVDSTNSLCTGLTSTVPSSDPPVANSAAAAASTTSHQSQQKVANIGMRGRGRGSRRGGGANSLPPPPQKPVRPPPVGGETEADSPR